MDYLLLMWLPLLACWPFSAARCGRHSAGSPSCITLWIRWKGAFAGRRFSRLMINCAQFERDTSNQVVVAIYPQDRLPVTIVNAYSVKLYQGLESWVRRENPTGRFCWCSPMHARRRLAPAMGWKGYLPDATCEQIIDNDIDPRFSQKPAIYDVGIKAGVAAIMAATRGEYVGTGSTQFERGTIVTGGVVLGVVVLLAVVLVIAGAFRDQVLFRRRAGIGYMLNVLMSFLLGVGYYFQHGGGSSGGGRGGGGGFSGGGGSGGGGGASGSW